MYDVTEDERSTTHAWTSNGRNVERWKPFVGQDFSATWLGSRVDFGSTSRGGGDLLHHSIFAQKLTCE